MEKEMMEKVNEILKANGKRELSMDELDKVVGGDQPIIYHIGQCTSEEDINYYVYTFIAGIENSFGKDIAADIIKTQIPSYDIEKYYRSGDLDTLHNFLCQHWERGWTGF